MRRAPLPARACVAFLLALLVGSAAAAAPARVAILPIVVHTLEEPEYLRSGLADMLASRLGRAGGVAVVRVEGEESATTDAETARRVGDDADADYVLFGSFTRFGEGASLDVRCLRVAAEDEEDARSIFIQSGTLGEIIPQLDGLAEKVSRYVQDGTRPPVAAGAGEAPPSASASGTAELQALRSELNDLRERLELLEQKLGTQASEGATAGSADEEGRGEPELASELR